MGWSSKWGDGMGPWKECLWYAIAASWVLDMWMRSPSCSGNYSFDFLLNSHVPILSNFWDECPILVMTSLNHGTDCNSARFPSFSNVFVRSREDTHKEIMREKYGAKNRKTIIGGYFRNHPQDLAKNFYYSLWTLVLRQVYWGDYRFNSLAKSAVAGIPHGIEVGMSTYECCSLSESEGGTESLNKKQQVRWTKPKIWIINTATRNKHKMEGSKVFGGSLFAF